MTRIIGADHHVIAATNSVWKVVVVVKWDYLDGLGKRKRSRRIRSLLREMGLLDDNIVSTRYDNILDRTEVYFRNETDASLFMMSLGDERQ